MSEQVEARVPSPTLASNLWLGATSALRALAFIAIFDREYRYAPWLHWIVVNWNAFLANVFSLLRLDIPPEHRTLFAFGMIMLGTVIAEKLLSYNQGSLVGSAPWKLGHMLGYMLEVLAMGGLLLLASIDNDGQPLFGFVPELYLYAGVCLLLAFAVATRTLLWLLAFVVVFVGLNELALAVGGSIPASPIS